MGRLDWDDLSALAFGLGVSTALVASYATGLAARPFLPAKHQTHESLEIVHAVIGMVVALIAILLGLQLDSATKSFADMQQLVERYSIQIVQVDSLLREFGPDAAPVRRDLAAYLTAATRNFEAGDGSDHAEQAELLREANLTLLQLTPTSALQSRVRSDSLTFINDLFQERWQIIAGADLTPSKPLYAVLVLWLVLVYAAFGLNASFNVPVFLVLVCSALAIGLAIFVLADMQTPFGGLISISPRPMQEALARLNK